MTEVRTCQCSSCEFIDYKEIVCLIIGGSDSKWYIRIPDEFASFASNMIEESHLQTYGIDRIYLGKRGLLVFGKTILGIGKKPQNLCKTCEKI